jgi:hypothetical protein
MYEDYIVYRGTVSFEKTRKIQLKNKNEDYGEEPEYEIMDEIEDVQDCEDDEKSVSRRIVIVEDMQELREKEHQEQEAEERQKQEAKEHQEQEAEERQKKEAKEHQEQEAKEHQEHEAKERREQETKEPREQEAKEQREQEANEQVEQEAKERDQTAKEQQETDEYRAEKLLKRGGIPLYPPGRRQWGERQVLISSNPTKIYWPPRNWKEYTPTERVTSWRFVAMALAREQGVSECRNEIDVLDEYAMLALPGIPVEKSTERSWTSTTKTANHNILREICLVRLFGEEAKGWLAMFQAAGSGIPDGKLHKQLELIPLRLDTEKVEKD